MNWAKLMLGMAIMAGANIAYSAPLPRIAFLSMGFKEAKMADFDQSPQAAKRHRDATGYLSITADFNGDGRIDEARLLLNKSQKIAHIVVVIQSLTHVDTYVLRSMTLEQANGVGIAMAKPIDAAKPDNWPGIAIFALDGSGGEANYFDGKEFDTRIPMPAQRDPAI